TAMTTSTIGKDWTKLYIAGEWVDGSSRKSIVDKNPYDGEVVAKVPAATREDADRAFEIAHRAYGANRRRTPQELARPIQEAMAIIETQADEIAHLLVIESGCTTRFAAMQVQQMTLAMMQEATSFPFRAFGQNIRSIIPGKENLVKRQPTGIVTVISPWNVP